MDISNLIPLIMDKNSNPTLSTLLNVMSGNKPNVLNVLNAVKNRKKTADISGLKPIKDIASDEIFAAMSRYFC